MAGLPMRIRAAYVVLLVVAWSAVINGDYKTSFKSGIQAVNRRNWTEAARFFQQAIAEQRTETGERIQISGMDFKPYLPQFYLGLALFNAGDCVGALAAWQASEGQGTIKRSSEYSQLTKLRPDCEKRVAAGTPPPVKPSAAQPTNSVPPAPSPPPRPVEPVGPSDAQLRATQSAMNKADQTRLAINGLNTEIVALQAGVWEEPNLGPAYRRVGDAFTTAAKTFDPKQPDAVQTQLESQFTSLDQQFEAIRLRGTARLEELRRAASTRNIGTGTKAPDPEPVRTPAKNDGTLPPVPTGAPPNGLRTAADHLFSARYQQARDTLATVTYSAGPAATQLHLLRAAAAYALFLVGGERDSNLLEEARQSIRFCKQTNVRVEADPAFFSPRFIELFRATR